MQNNKHTLPLVTIGMPTFNRADSYLKDALKSAVSQTYSNIEIIISDNASTDNTEALIRSFNDPRIKYFKQSANIGGLNNANFCVEQAKGDYFVLLHDDDLIDNDFIEACMKAVDFRTDVGIILAGTRVIDESCRTKSETPNRVEGTSPSDLFLSWFDNKLALYLCSTLYNTKRLQDLGCFRSKKNLYEDNVALFQIAAKYGRKDVHEVKASFRMHSSNSGTAASISDWCEDSLYLLNIMCDLSGDKREIVRKRGMIYFCRVNYNYIRRNRDLKSLAERAHAYWFVYKMFGYCCSPIYYLISKNILYKALRSFIRKDH
jgi:glycosyltransferase involved in cell wall biosynthesis